MNLRQEDVVVMTFTDWLSLKPQHSRECHFSLPAVVVEKTKMSSVAYLAVVGLGGRGVQLKHRMAFDMSTVIGEALVAGHYCHIANRMRLRVDYGVFASVAAVVLVGMVAKFEVVAITVEACILAAASSTAVETLLDGWNWSWLA